MSESLTDAIVRVANAPVDTPERFRFAAWRQLNEPRFAAFARLECRMLSLGMRLPAEEAALYASEREWHDRGHRAEHARVDAEVNAVLRARYGL